MLLDEVGAKLVKLRRAVPHIRWLTLTMVEHEGWVLVSPEMSTGFQPMSVGGTEFRPGNLPSSPLDLTGRWSLGVLSKSATKGCHEKLGAKRLANTPEALRMPDLQALEAPR